MKIEIEQKLREIGFFGKTDLETILEALPKLIKFKGDIYRFWMTFSGSSDCYILGYVCGQIRRSELEIFTYENESLADTAARLLIKLAEKGLVKFKE